MKERFATLDSSKVTKMLQSELKSISPSPSHHHHTSLLNCRLHIKACKSTLNHTYIHTPDTLPSEPTLAW